MKKSLYIVALLYSTLYATKEAPKTDQSYTQSTTSVDCTNKDANGICWDDEYCFGRYELDLDLDDMKITTLHKEEPTQLKKLRNILKLVVSLLNYYCITLPKERVAVYAAYTYKKLAQKK